MRSKRHASWALLCLILVAAGALSGCKTSSTTFGLDKGNPQPVTVWHYYNGAQKQIFDELVTEFNEGVGAEQGVVVLAYSQGTVNELSAKVIDAIDRKVGALQVPDIFAAYADTAYEIYRREKAVDVSKYFSKEDLEKFVPAYLSEGEFKDGQLMIVPVAKSTEILMLNKTDWDAFAAETGASDEGFATWEGLREIARAYYEWTDAKTEAPCDGKAFFGRDVMANYVIIGSMQLGTELFAVKDGKVTLGLDKEVFRRLWDNYYVPYVNGHYAAIGRFRSDDAKTGDIIALVGATTGAAYFPKEVTRQDATTYPIETAVYPLPDFAGEPPYAVQQGAGMVVTKSDERREYAASLFLKWFTEPEQNVRFSIGSGYLPVHASANDEAVIGSAIEGSASEISAIMKDTLTIGVDTVKNRALYTSKAFEHGSDARAVLESSLQNRADADRAQVLLRMEGGMSLTEAVAPYVTGDCFDAWFDEFAAELNAAIAD